MKREYVPQRHDEVATWLKHQRDLYEGRLSYAWLVVDRLLDLYREKADYGLPLDEDGGDP